jgi:hypothetical protein
MQRPVAGPFRRPQASPIEHSAPLDSLGHDGNRAASHVQKILDRLDIPPTLRALADQLIE